MTEVMQVQQKQLEAMMAPEAHVFKFKDPSTSGLNGSILKNHHVVVKINHAAEGRIWN